MDTAGALSGVAIGGWRRCEQGRQRFLGEKSEGGRQQVGQPAITPGLIPSDMPFCKRNGCRAIRGSGRRSCA